MLQVSSAIYTDKFAAELAVARLLSQGLRKRDIGIAIHKVSDQEFIDVEQDMLLADGIVAKGILAAAAESAKVQCPTIGSQLLAFGVDPALTKAVRDDLSHGCVLVCAQAPEEWKRDIQYILENAGGKRVGLH